MKLFWLLMPLIVHTISLWWWSIILTFGEHCPTERRVGQPQFSDYRSLLRRNFVFELLWSHIRPVASSLTLRRWAGCDYLFANAQLFLLPPKRQCNQTCLLWDCRCWWIYRGVASAWSWLRLSRKRFQLQDVLQNTKLIKKLENCG